MKFTKKIREEEGMGKKDDYQYDYLDDPERFADQVNGALFGGRQHDEEREGAVNRPPFAFPFPNKQTRDVTSSDSAFSQK